MVLKRLYSGWIVSPVVVLAAGLIGGWVFRDTRPQPAAPSGGPAPSTTQAAPERHENRLAAESSPYLLLHKDNPVDWYPWGAEALEKAKREHKPIFLSIGYSSCYWCHVMERESFTDPAIAAFLNEHFVSIKVDREELPDVDDAYMTAVQAMTGRGGWPLSVFLTADAKPFFGGTYFPPTDREGATGFRTVLERVVAVWRDQRGEAEAVADQVTRLVEQAGGTGGFALKKLDRSVLEQAVAELARRFDPEHGGFGFDPAEPRRPKFPQPPTLDLLSYTAAHDDDARARAMLTLTLDRIMLGGIHDHVGGGFHRYSTDRRWLVPHFEKMLYDNAQLASVFVAAFELTGDERYRDETAEIFEFVMRELRAPEGGFYSALDAESDGEEGKYYVWTKHEVRDLLGTADFPLFAAVYGLDGPANFEQDRYVLERLEDPVLPPEVGDLSGAKLEARLEPMRKKLLAARATRHPPLRDTKVLADWNGLMIAALTDAYRVSDEASYRQAAEAAAQFILDRMRDRDGRLLHAFAAGRAHVPAYLDDYASVVHGLLALERATQDEHWLQAAQQLTDRMLALFEDSAGGGFYSTGSDEPAVLVRVKPLHDSVTPSGNGLAVRNLVALAGRTGDPAYGEHAARALAVFAGAIMATPSAQPAMVRGLGEYFDAGLPNVLLTARRPEIEPDVVSARAAISLDRLQPGRKFQVAVMLDIAPGWHIYAHPAAPKEVVPTSVEIASDLPVAVSKIEYPIGKLMNATESTAPVSAYSGRVLIRAAASLADDAPLGKSELTVALRYQACDQERCLAPRTIKLRVPVEVVGKDQPVRELLPDLLEPAGGSPTR